MAQWAGQYSGFTHGTKVQDLEDSLRKAVTALADSSVDARENQNKVVRRLAERLLVARLKLLHARIAAASELRYRNGKASAEQVPKLELRARGVEADGLEGILREFGASANVAD